MPRSISLRRWRAAAAGLALLALAGAAQAQYTNSMNRGFTFNNIYAMQADMTPSNMIRQGQMKATHRPRTAEHLSPTEKAMTPAHPTKPLAQAGLSFGIALVVLAGSAVADRGAAPSLLPGKP
jgi:hypothetical protein